MNSWCGFILKGAKRLVYQYRIAHARPQLRVKFASCIKKHNQATSKLRFNTSLCSSKKVELVVREKKRVRDGRVQIIPNAIECKKFEFCSQSERRCVNSGYNDELVIMHVGNLNPVKNHAFLLQVFAELKKKFTFAKLILIGRDGHERFNQRLAQQLKIDSDVIFLGERSNVPELLQQVIYSYFHLYMKAFLVQF
jgi:glycosyltransferase involved in cell wall biosynthesis